MITLVLVLRHSIEKRFITHSLRKENFLNDLYLMKLGKFILSFLLFLPFILIVSTEASYKVNESGGRQVDGNYCGDQITDLYDNICSSGKRKRSKLITNDSVLW